MATTGLTIHFVPTVADVFKFGQLRVGQGQPYQRIVGLRYCAVAGETRDPLALVRDKTKRGSEAGCPL